MKINAGEQKDRWIEAIHENDIGAVRAILAQSPELLHASLPGVDGGAALSLAAQGNHLDMVKALVPYGPTDVQQALSRASMRAHREVSEYLVMIGANPNGLYSETAIDYGPVILAACEALNPEGIQLMIDLGADPNVKHRTSQGDIHSPLGFILGAYARNTRSKHACLEVLSNAGVPLEDTPLMAFHRGRLDLLEKHLRNDPDLVRRRFQAEDIYRPELGFSTAMTLAPIEGTTLLHLAMEYDEFDIAEWLIERGADVNARAAIDADGCEGHTPLFHAAAAVLSPTDERTRFLLARGADPAVRATIRHPRDGWDELADRVFEAVTALEYALLFKDAPSWCNRDSIPVLASLDE
ncbi:ankyrin repeat domain-containing protein [Paenibacillus sp. GCM10023250]|uniref:ankyrin repeat domain-containing protein n=1 Tax=Paenibacillus sp. GCM10023250 TaxID=3252648 RepID=UPI00360BB6A4